MKDSSATLLLGYYPVLLLPCDFVLCLPVSPSCVSASELGLAMKVLCAGVRLRFDTAAFIAAVVIPQTLHLTFYTCKFQCMRIQAGSTQVINALSMWTRSMATRLRCAGGAPETSSGSAFYRCLSLVPRMYQHVHLFTYILIIVLHAGADAQKEVPVIVFGHGFSQPVRVYMGTLKRLARELGAVIIAPYTSLAVALPWKAVQGAGAGPLGALTAPPPAKLQVRVPGVSCGFGFQGFRAAGCAHSQPARDVLNPLEVQTRVYIICCKLSTAASSQCEKGDDSGSGKLDVPAPGCPPACKHHLAASQG